MTHTKIPVGGIFSHLRIGGRTQVRPNKGFSVTQCQSVGEAIEFARKFRGFSRYQLSAFMGNRNYVPDKPGLYVSLLEQNKITPTDLDFLKLKTYLGVDLRHPSVLKKEKKKI
eukprot:GDKJ01002352.1.p1 GENE.GDKJ01002352.1~~GDKJ01002352.1.p1  ORF type:complete len:113 (+),score=14.11 GDKJ01002352.1:20-358(+)